MLCDPTEKMDNVDILTDRQLLARFLRSSDGPAFEALVRRHGPLVKNVCKRVLQHDQDTEDAFQATFLVLARKARSIQAFQSLAGWLYKVAYRIALRARANRTKRKLNENRLLTEAPAAAPAQRERDIDILVDEEVQRLPEKYRTPVLLCYLQGQTNEQAAQILRCPTGTIKIRLLRGREMLRKRLVRQGVALSIVALLADQGAAVTAATVPPPLVAGLASAALQLHGGAALTQLALSSSVLRLAQSWFKRAAIAKVKVACAVLLTVLLLVVTDYLAQQALAATASVLPKNVPTDRAPSLPLPEYQTPPAPQPELFVDQVNAQRWASAEKVER